MKVSTKGRYGLRAMVDLAVNSKNDHISIKSIAERQSISENYLEQVFSALRKAGLVKSIKGSQGGYILSISPSQITVGQILKALEGSLEVVDSIKGSDYQKNKIEQVVSMVVWNKINEGINSLVDSITLESLADEYKKISEKEAMMYYI